MINSPIIYSGAMVRALLDGRKTMTRRLRWKLVKRGPHPDGAICFTNWNYVRPGDRLWVRENWRAEARYDKLKPREIPAGSLISYEADYDQEPNDGCRGKLRPAIFLPRWASRMTLTVTAAKVEHLPDISEEDAIAEGFTAGKLDDGFGPRDIGDGWTIESPGGWASAAGHFQKLWCELHGFDSWDQNPEVVALSFTVHKSNIDQLSEVA
ncbi:MAG: hypothetical protein E6Q98_15805 [Rhodospirillaceae bacterium]|nr:MAG: hypothetical protein E6Q98_15805 [Rhodospirillaceae bacterium]